MGSNVRQLEGFASLGGEIPYLTPHAIKIVGVDLPQSSEHWFAFCPRAGDDLEPEWIDDIRRNGVRSPVDVYRDGNEVIMLEGRRRVTAARLVYDEQKKAGVPDDERIKVRVNIRRGSPMELFAYNVGSENRKARSPLQRAMLMTQAKKFGADDKTVAEMFMCTTATVKNMLSLFDLSPEVQKAVDTGTLAIREAIKLTGQTREQQREILGKLVEAGATKGSRASNSIRDAKNGAHEKIGTDTTRSRSRDFLEKWKSILHKEGYTKEEAIIRFVLGGPASRDWSERFKETVNAVTEKKT